MKRKVKNTIMLILDVIVVLLVIFFIIGYFNFSSISKGKEPVYEGVISSYEKGDGTVTVHDYMLYKVVKYEIPKKNVTYSMKLFFMDDVK